MAPRPRPLAERLAERLVTDPATGCRNWTGAKNLKGYGRIKTITRSALAHRVAYELAKGPIPGGLQIDHLCRNPACCNPDHLEAVTPLENTRRGNSGLKDRLKTHCPAGHPYDEENTGRVGKVGRYCRTCKREQGIRWRAKMNMAPLPSGATIPAINAAKTHCKRGHELTAQNTYRRGNWRDCRACRGLRVRGLLSPVGGAHMP